MAASLVMDWLTASTARYGRKNTLPVVPGPVWAPRSICHRSSPPRCDPRTHGGTRGNLPCRPAGPQHDGGLAGLRSGQAGQAQVRGTEITDSLATVRSGGAIQHFGGYIGDTPARIARLLAQRVKGGDRVQAVGAHQIADGTLDDHPVVEGVLQLVGHGAVLLGHERGGQDLRDEAAVG